jgi:uncharacterized membrane protein YdbT with pleckstrin-like domain
MENVNNVYNSQENNNKPYIARKSAWQGVKARYILLFWLIIPLIIMIFKIITVKHEYLEIYQNKIIQHKGWLSRHEKEIALVGINAIGVDQTFLGRIFKYGDIRIDVVGKHDITFNHIKKPYELKQYLESQVNKASTSNQSVIFG